jgi:hypothetical protein
MFELIAFWMVIGLFCAGFWLITGASMVATNTNLLKLVRKLAVRDELRTNPGRYSTAPVRRSPARPRM